MKNKIKTKLNININKDDSDLNDFLYCWSKFGSRPNKVIIYNSYLKDTFSDVISEYIQEKNVFTEVIPSDTSIILNDKMLVKLNENLYLSYLIIDRTNENSVIHDIAFFFNNYEEELNNINEIISKLDDCIFDIDIDISYGKINTITLSQNGLDIENINFSGLDEDIEYYYTSNTLKEVNKLSKLIKKSHKGLSLLQGPRGTGKTSIINYLSEKLDKTIIFVPSNMMDITFNNPEFKNFLKKHQNSFLIIDDCEMLFNQIFTKSNLFVNNLLQLVDGPLSDSLNINILMIFNTDDVIEIDESLLDCNNLLGMVEFDLLDSDESNELSKHIGSKKKYQNKTKLIDIIKKRHTTPQKKVGL